MKFIHTSDWHIGRQFHNVSLLDDQLHALNQLVTFLKENEVDALIIAGDIYDRSVPPSNAVTLLDDILNQICTELAIPIVLIPGNHDSADRLCFGSRQLKEAGLHVLGNLENIEQSVTLTGKSGVRVNFYGMPFNQPENVNHQFDVTVSTHDEAHTFLVNKIKETMNVKQNNVLISHCFVGGCDPAEESESERPLSIGGSGTVSYEALTDFTYVALGHLHGPQFRGEEHIQYAGSILKYSFSEQKQKKGVTLVEIDRAGKPTIKRLPLQPLRDMRLIEGTIKQIIKQGKTDPYADDYIMVRLTDKHAILDAMGKLRDVYPNILHLEKIGLKALGEKRTLNREHLKRNELEMFKDFYTQVSDSTLSIEQGAALEIVINDLRQMEANK